MVRYNRTKISFSCFLFGNPKYISLALIYMKNTVCFFLCVLFCGSFYSQRKNEFHLSLGYSQAAQTLNPFINISNWNQNIKNVFGGVEYYHNFNSESALGIGLQTTEKGFKNSYSVEFPGYTSTLDYFFRLNYIEMPVMYRHTFKKPFYTRKIFFNIGGVGSYLIKSAQGNQTKKDYHDGRISYAKGSSYNPKVFKKVDVGLLARVGYEFYHNCNVHFTFTQSFLRPYIYNSGELNYQTCFFIGLTYNFN